MIAVLLELPSTAKTEQTTTKVPATNQAEAQTPPPAVVIDADTGGVYQVGGATASTTKRTSTDTLEPPEQTTKQPRTEGASTNNKGGTNETRGTTRPSSELPEEDEPGHQSRQTDQVSENSRPEVEH